MTDVTNALIALKDGLTNLSISLENEKQQHKNLLKELNNYLQNSQQNIETNIEDFLKNIELSNLINATNQAQQNIDQQEQAIKFLSQKIENLGTLVDESILKVGEQHDKMLNDIKENSLDVRSEIIKAVSIDFKKDVISSFLIEIRESIDNFKNSVETKNNDTFKEIIGTYNHLIAQVKEVKDNHKVALVDFQNHVATFNKTMNESIAGVATAFSAVKQQCVNFTKKLFEENKVLLNEIVKQIAEETETVKTEVNQASIEIIDNFKKNIIASQKYFDEEVTKLNNAISTNSTNTLNLIQRTKDDFEKESKKLFEAQKEYSSLITSKSEKIITAQEFACKQLDERLKFKFFASNAVLVLIITLIFLIALNMYGTYRYAELSSYNIALISETQKLTKEKDRLYSIRHDIQKLTNGSIAELRKKIPQLAINCTTDPQ